MEVGRNGGGLVADSGGATIIVGPQYCVPRLVDLTFTKKVPGIKNRHLAVVDADGKVMYKVERHHLSLRGRKLLLDPSDQPILLLQSEHKTSHSVYDAFRGNSRDAKDLLFKIKKVSATEVHVIFAANSRESSRDFKVSEDISNRTVAVLRGDSTEVAAKMTKDCKFTSEAEDEEAFGVAVSPNMDSCFIAALFAVFHEVSSAKVAIADQAKTQGGVGAWIAEAAVEGVAISASDELIEIASEFIFDEES